ncbi:MAG: hypothetical protein H0W50_08005 [Parachlamydiaceae bacterium]|nr:hypothetical protein [Parachlamydiaceae bacterium]
MANNSLDFSNVQSQVSALYKTASNIVAYGFSMIQELLPRLTAADAKTMVFGAAFFASASANPGLTALTTAFGAFGNEFICDLGKKGIELFNAQTSLTKYAVVAGVILALAMLKFIGFFTSKVLKPLAVVAVGLYAGVVLGKPRTK